MGQYIPKNALVAEIGRIDNSIGNDRFLSEYEKGCNQGKEEVCDTLRNFLDTLEVKEVDFEGTKSVFEGQYLSKDKVVTTIERLQDECEEKGDNNGVELLEKLFNKLDTLEVKEVDLEKEIDRWQGCEAFPEGVGISPLPKAMEIVERTAKHFFELGLKAQKGK